MGYGDNQIDGYTEGEEPLIFHTKKGEYQQYEKKEYRDMARGVNQPKRGFLRVLVNSRGNRILFFVMMACIALVFILTFINSKRNECSISHINCALKAFSYGDKVYASVELEPNKNTPLDVPLSVQANFSFYDTDGTMVDSGMDSLLFEFKDPKEDSRFLRYDVTDFNLGRVECVLEVNGESSEMMMCKIDKH